jgi:hypothetical protein
MHNSTREPTEMLDVPVEHIHHISDKDKKIQYKNFIPTIQNAFLEYNRAKNCIQGGNDFSTVAQDSSQLNKNSFENEVQLKKQFNELYKTCSANQKVSVDRIEKALVQGVSSSPNSQLLMFNSGPGGTGKSYIIKLGKLLAKIHVGKTKGIYGPSLALAATGSAANQIQGFTIQSALSMGRTGTKNLKDITSGKAALVAKKLEGVMIIFIDEISLISLEMLYKIHMYLCLVRLAMEARTEEDSERNKILAKMPFGGFHIVFSGDFYQLPPITGVPLYLPPSDSNISIQGKKLWNSINFYVDLVVNFRIDDPNTSLLSKFLAGNDKIYKF